MGFWFFMLAMVLLIPLSMLFLGRYFIRHSPTKINYVFGYRTRMSMKNQDTWQFAHRHFGKTWYVCGLVLTPLSVLGMLLVLGKDENAVGHRGHGALHDTASAAAAFDHPDRARTAKDLRQGRQPPLRCAVLRNVPLPFLQKCDILEAPQSYEGALS